MKKSGRGEVLVVGAGITGVTIAQCLADAGYGVELIDKRDHIGGNCSDYINEDGILVSRYGAHLFHTNDESVWSYIKKFSQWEPYRHTVFSFIEGKHVPVPINIETINILFGLGLKDPEEMKRWLEKEVEIIDDPKNSEEVALKIMGKRLYEKLFKNYTYKTWGRYPIELEASVISRIPMRFSLENHYFDDKYQFQPKYGFTKLFEKMIDNPKISLKLKMDFGEIKNHISKDTLVIYTGPIDEYFDYVFGKLEFRQISFTPVTYDKEYKLPNAVVNYPGEEEYFRAVEHKYISRQKHNKTVVSYERGVSSGIPCYPVLTVKNQQIYSKYLKKSQGEDNVIFAGRMGMFKYINMDVAIKEAMALVENLIKNETK